MSQAQPYIPRIGERMASSEKFRSSKRSELKIWWREIDRVLLFLILLLMAFGTAAVAAASPASARRLSTAAVTLPDLYFYWSHLKWQFVGLIALFGASMLSRDNARRLGVLVAAGALFLLILVPLFGSEINGAKRWINLGMRLQPSEFLKPEINQNPIELKDYYGLVVQVIAAIATFLAVLAALFREEIRRWWEYVKIDYSIPNENFREIINPNTGNSGDGENTPIEAEKYVCEMEVMNKGTVSSLTSEIVLEINRITLGVIFSYLGFSFLM